MNVLKKILSWFNCKPIQILFQGLSYFCIVYTYVFYCLHCWGSFCPIWTGGGGEGLRWFCQSWERGVIYPLISMVSVLGRFLKTHLIPVFGSPKVITPSQIFLKSYGLPPPPLYKWYIHSLTQRCLNIERIYELSSWLFFRWFFILILYVNLSNCKNK